MTNAPVTFRDHAFLGTTQSLCPDCLTLVQAKIIQRQGRVYFRKRCPEHGVREDFVCSDVGMFDQMQYSLPGKLPREVRVEPARGCPYDCGLCTEHEQHTCIGVLEITSSCNLECPVCYASSAPGGTHLSMADCLTAMDSLIAAEHRTEVLQLSGGEPTVHPQFLQIFAAACERPIDIVMINTNGVRLARDDDFLDQIAAWRHRSEIYLQFDGFDDQIYDHLRGESLLETKLTAIDRLGEAGMKVILVCTVQPHVNVEQLGRIVDFGVQRAHITGVSFQPATYVGRYVLPDELEQRVTFPDVIRGVAAQTNDWKVSDFMPLPCAHPNAHSLSYAYRSGDKVLPLRRFLDIESNLDLLANGITFTRSQAKRLIEQYMSRSGCCGGEECGAALPPIDSHADRPGSDSARHVSPDAVNQQLAAEFLQRAVEQDLGPADVFRITTTSFMDAYNFDVRQLMKSCVHHVLPSGHLIPFSAYNVLYRNGHVPLPKAELRRAMPQATHG